MSSSDQPAEAHAPVYASLRQPLVTAPRTLAGITDDIVGQMLRRPTIKWWAAFAAAASLLALGVGTVCGLAFILDLPVVARALAWPGRRRSATQPKASV